MRLHLRYLPSSLFNWPLGASIDSQTQKQTWRVSHRMWWNLNRISNVLKTHIEVFELPQPKVITDLWVSYHKIGCHTCLGTGQSQKEEVEQLHSQLSCFLSSGMARRVGLFCPWAFAMPLALARSSLAGQKVINLSAQPWLLHKLSYSTLSWLLCSPISTMFFRTVTLWTKELIAASFQIWAPPRTRLGLKYWPHAGREW